MDDARSLQYRGERLLAALERLLQIEATELSPALNQASQIAAETLGADKVDVFLYENDSDSLVAIGTSDTPMGRAQRRAGLHRQPLANNGPLSSVFETGRSHLTGHADREPGQPLSYTERLGIRSEMDCGLNVNSDRRGVVHCAAAAEERFDSEDLQFLEATSRWIGMVLHRTELFERLRAESYQDGRRAAAEELVSLLTPRQREVAGLVGAGLSNRQIAERLVVSERTVANHVQSILDRLGAERRTQVVAWISEGVGTNHADEAPRRHDRGIPPG
jgi:DNA-binding CsgD family transcriptional regulator